MSCGFPVPERRRLEEHLDTPKSAKIGRHPNIAENLDATFLELGALVGVIVGRTGKRWRRERRRTGSVRPKKIMLGARGLHALHKQKVVRRDSRLDSFSFARKTGRRFSRTLSLQNSRRENRA